MKRARSLEDIVANGLCTGCGLCESLAGAERVSMGLNAGGFLRPRRLAPLPREVEDRIVKVCPGNVQHLPGRADGAGAPADTIWGALAGLFEGHATDAELRFKGSSGGVLTAVALHLLETGRAAAVLEIAADPERPLHAMTQIARDRAAVLRGAGSWYGPAAPLRRLHELLDAGEPFAVIGKPCDIAGVRNLARIDPRVDRLVVCTLSFLCAGVSSHAVVHNVIGHHGLAEKDVRLFRFRGHGCPGPTRIESRDGRVFQQTYDETWSNALNQAIQFRCKICPDSTGEQADIVCADSWDDGDGYAHGEREGRGAVLARSRRGLSILHEMEERGSLHLRPLDLGRFERTQMHHRHRKSVVIARLAGLWLTGQMVPHFRGLRLVRSGLHGWRALASSLSGTIRRVRRGANRESLSDWTPPT